MVIEEAIDAVALNKAFLVKIRIKIFSLCFGKSVYTYILGYIDARGDRKLITYTHMRQLLSLQLL